MPWILVLLIPALGAPVRAETDRANSARPDNMLEEVVVTAGLRTTSRDDLPQSVTVLSGATLRNAGVQHFEDVLGLVPGLSWAGGTSRSRYFQIRGIGETEQYQGAPNPSVGLLIDDIDFSGIGAPATLFDLNRIEVLRGPNSTIYGANALAGLISLRSEDPGRRFDLRGESTVGDYGTKALGLVVGDGRADGSAGWRLAGQRYRSDGFFHNTYLNRNDTNGFDETTVRGKFAWQPGPQLHVGLALLYANLDNGYDTWSLDSSYFTRANQPGRDAQRSSGVALRLHYQATTGEVISVFSHADSHIIYSFDGDWGNDTYWGPNAPYDYFEQHLRTRRTTSQDLRFVGDAEHWWSGRLRPVAGVYAIRLQEGDAQTDTWRDQYSVPGTSVLKSTFQATNLALYGSLEWRASRLSTLALGLRSEHRSANYTDSSDEPFAPARSALLGGNLAWNWHWRETRQYYATLARSYKAGGFNIGAQIDPSQRQFNAEALWSLELGLRQRDPQHRWDLQTDVYAMRRTDMQVYTARQLVPTNPLTYVFLTTNAAHGNNIGVESELQWRPGALWQIGATASVQATRYLGYFNGALDLRGRAQAFAPAWQWGLSANYAAAAGWFVRADLQAQAGYYFSASHNQRAAQRRLVNLRCGWRWSGWVASIWGRNVLNERYAVQGFYFADEPPDFPTKLYQQNGNPRQLGVTVSFDLDQR